MRKNILFVILVGIIFVGTPMSFAAAEAAAPVASGTGEGRATGTSSISAAKAVAVGIAAMVMGALEVTTANATSPAAHQ